MIKHLKTALYTIAYWIPLIGGLIRRMDAFELEVLRVKKLRMALALAQGARAYPKKRSVIFVGQNHTGFADNIKYAYLACLKWARENEVECYFMTENEDVAALLKSNNLPHIYPDSTKWEGEEIKKVASTKVVVHYSHFTASSWHTGMPFALVQGAKSIQLWHGVPIKHIGFEVLQSTKIYETEIIQQDIFSSCGPFDAFVGTAKSMEPEWKRSFAFRHYAALGYARNDVLYRKPTAEDLLNVDEKAYRAAEAAHKEGRAVIIYAPTWRSVKGADWFRKVDIGKLARHCRGKGHLLLVALHPIEQHAVPELRKAYPGVMFLEPLTDCYPLLHQSTVLITDYSSIAFDYLHLDRPVIFYRPDHEDYVRYARGLIESYTNRTPGDVVTGADALCAAVDKALTADGYHAARVQQLKELYDHHDGHAGERLAELIKGYLDAPEEMP